jgi:rhodanese-related sulfurtransferase
MGDRKAKDALFDGFALVGKAVASGRRAEIIDVLAQGERSVEDIATEISQTVANTSQHLRQLLRAGLVVTRRDGNRVFYALSSRRVGDLWAAVRDVAASHVAEVGQLAEAYLGDRSQLESLSKKELAQRLRSGEVVVLDVRPSSEFAAGHIRGAVSIPVSELSRRLKELPKDKQVVAYCRGQYCVYADDAVRVLQKKGYDAARLEDGYPEWERAGLPIG